MKRKPNLRIKRFQNDWSSYLMKDVIKDMYNGQTPYRSNPVFWNGDINWISSGDLNRAIVLKSTEKITKAGKEDAHLRLIPKGTFVMAITGLEAAGTRGNCGILGIDTTMNQSCMALFPQEDKLDTQFLFQWYRNYSEELGIKLTQGTKQQSYNASIVKNIEICLPSLEEQKQISLFLSSLDRLITETNIKIGKLKQLKHASLQSMFPQKDELRPVVRFKGYENDWCIVKLEDCLEICTERNLDNKFDKYQVLSVSDEVGVVNQIKLLGRSYAGKSVSNYKVLRTNQIVYTKSPLKAKPYGIFKVNKGEIGIVSVLYAVYNAKQGVCPDFIHYYFDPCHRINNYLLPLVNKGAKNTMNISDEMALQGKISIPSYEEQIRIAAFLRNIDRQIVLQSQRLERLKQIKSTCLSKMFV